MGRSEGLGLERGKKGKKGGREGRNVRRDRLGVDGGKEESFVLPLMSTISR